MSCLELGFSRPVGRKPAARLAAIAALLFATVALGGSTAALAATEAGAPSAAAPARAIFAGGCFWCMEPPFDDLPGVVSTTSGYIGGHKTNPSYEEVSSGGTGHTEAVEVVYDPAQISYEKLLHVFWRNVDPLTANRQFCDAGTQYRAGIFYLNEEQRALAEASKATLETTGRFGHPIVTEITAAGTFYKAEKYHQNYYKKNALRYKYYRNGCGRDQRLQELWGDEAGG